VPLVILVVDLLLNTTIVDVDSSKDFLIFRGVEGLSSLSDLVEKLSPLFNIFTKIIINHA
jgi:hypothetical protein